MEVKGTVTFTLTSGKVVGPYSADYVPDRYYVDVTKGSGDYPTLLDHKKYKTVVSINFKPHIGRAISWSRWTYFNNGPWMTDRFTDLS